MDTMDQIYLWKQLYWDAIARGLDPEQAAEAANRALPAQPRDDRARDKTLSDSSPYPPAAA